MSLKKMALSGVYWTSILQACTTIIAFGVSVILARILLPKEFGLIASLTIFISIGHLLMNSGMSSSLIRTKEIKDIDISTVFYFNLLASVVIYGIIYISAPYIALFYDQDILTSLVRVLSLTLIIQAFSLIQNTLLTKDMEFRKIAYISIPAILSGAIVGIVMAMNGYGVWSLVFQSLTSITVKSILLLSYGRWKMSFAFENSVFKKHFNFGFNLTLSGLINSVFENIYVILIGKFFPMAQLGFYQKANGLSMMPTTAVSNIVTKVSYPLLSKIQDDDQKLKSTIKRIIKLVIFIITPVLLCMVVLATPLFRFLFTEKWLPAVPYFQIVFLNALLLPIHGFNLIVLMVKGRSDLFLKAEVIKKFLVLAIILLVFQYGILGLLYGSVIASILSLIVNIYYCAKIINYSAMEQFIDLAPALLLGLCVSSVVYFMDTVIQGTLSLDIIRLLIGGSITLVSYSMIAYLAKMDAMQEILRLVKTRL